MGQTYKGFLERDDLNIIVRNCREFMLTERGALNLYKHEQEQRNELVNDMIDILGNADNPVGIVTFIANKALEGDEMTEAALDEIIKGAPISEEVVKEGLIGTLKTTVVNEFCNAIDELHDDFE